MIKSIHIKNFKSLEDVTFEFTSNLALLTGVNNSGKSTVLEALSLWGEIFYLNLRQAGRKGKGEGKFAMGDYMFGAYNSKENNFEYSDFNSIRIADKKSLFLNNDTRNIIEIAVTYKTSLGEIEIPFIIKSATGNALTVGIHNHKTYDYVKLNEVITNFPEPFEIFYSAPLFGIVSTEELLIKQKFDLLRKSRRSSEILRNKIYDIESNPGNFSRFVMALQKVLVDNKQQIQVILPTRKSVDLFLEVNIQIGKKLPQPIENFGSGTIQIIELLTNLFGDGNKLNLLLLDEPDSYIHRDIQKRLIELFIQQDKEATIQFIMTSHNEALIRSFPVNAIYHLTENNNGVIKPFYQSKLSNTEYIKKGLQTNSLTPIIKSINETTGIDFINALEADKIVFVEGTTEAFRINNLLQKFTDRGSPKNIVYWSLDGIDEAYKNINHYKTVLSQIKNGKSLWDKCYLILDRDYLTDDLRLKAIKHFEDLGLKTFMFNAHSFEADLLSNIQNLYVILNRYFQLIDNQVTYNLLIDGIDTVIKNKKEKFNINNDQNVITNKTIATIDKSVKYISNDNTASITKATIEIQKHIESSLSQSAFYKIADKEDVKDIVTLFGEQNNVKNISYNFNDIIEKIEFVTTINQDYQSILNLLK